MKTAVVLGGGMGGMVAADELAQRGYKVTVYERWDRWGGKARSFSRYDSASEDRKGLPGEHGFRFFPGWYRHVPNSMKSTPTKTGNVFDNLVQASTVVIAQIGWPRIEIPSRFPRSRAACKLLYKTYLERYDYGLTKPEFILFAMKMLDLMAKSKARRDVDYMGVAWWEYIEAAKMSPQYQKLLATGLTRTLVAMKAEIACTRTVGNILIQMLIYATAPGKASDRVLDGPTSDVWIHQWRDKLRDHEHVTLIDETVVQSLEMEGDRITRAEIRSGDTVQWVEADYFVAAVPVEQMVRLLNEDIRKRAPSLARLDNLKVEWMNGQVFYLNKDIKLTHGHSILADSPWAMTAISQPQFWKTPMDEYGRGFTKGVLSTDISNWVKPGNQVIFKAAEDCSALEIATEAWAQVKAHFHELSDADLIAPLDDPDLRSWFLDPDIDTSANEPGGDSEAEADQKFDNHSLPESLRGLISVFELNQRTLANEFTGRNTNAEPLLINTVNSWYDRPHAYTEIENLVLASDYVRTNTDLATMEGANEAGRRAVNHILKIDGSDAKPCKVYTFPEMWIFAPFRGLDWLLLKLGLPSINWHWLWRLGLWAVQVGLHVVVWFVKKLK